MAEGLLAEKLDAFKAQQVDDEGASAAFKASVLGAKPNWSGLVSPGSAAMLDRLHGVESDGVKGVFQANSEMLKACLEAVGVTSNPQAVQYVLMTIFEGCRSDASLVDTLVTGANQTDVYGPFTAMLKRPGQGDNKYAADKAAYLLTSIMSHAGIRLFAESQLSGVTQGLVTAQFGCTEKGVMDGLANLLKCDAFRAAVWNTSGVKELIAKVQATGPSALVYKSIFCIWMLSFNNEILQTSLEKADVAGKLKDAFATSRVEKVIRIGLNALKNCLKSPKLADAIVEKGTLEVLQALEYEKWRDAELYDDIREMSNLVSARVHEMSNFDRYERELASGNLAWGFIHSEKFWNDNVMKFEKDEFRAIKTLATLLTSANLTTLSVACHDIGEFVRLHPIGKKLVGRFGIKGSVMSLMSHGDREVAREALLCVQKIMLNKWQDINEA